MSCKHQEPPIGAIVVVQPLYGCIFCEVERLQQQAEIDEHERAEAGNA